jgi:hypothetical protein
VSYMYLPNKSVKCGRDWPWDKKATPGQWIKIVMYIRVNDPGPSLPPNLALHASRIRQACGRFWQHFTHANLRTMAMCADCAV